MEGYCTSAIACLQAEVENSLSAGNTTNRFARIETAVTARRFVETQVESWHSYAERGARDAALRRPVSAVSVTQRTAKHHGRFAVSPGMCPWVSAPALLPKRCGATNPPSPRRP